MTQKNFKPGFAAKKEPGFAAAKSTADSQNLTLGKFIALMLGFLFLAVYMELFKDDKKEQEEKYRRELQKTQAALEKQKQFSRDMQVRGEFCTEFPACTRPLAVVYMADENFTFINGVCAKHFTELPAVLQKHYLEEQIRLRELGITPTPNPERSGWQNRWIR